MNNNKQNELCRMVEAESSLANNPPTVFQSGSVAAVPYNSGMQQIPPVPYYLEPNGYPMTMPGERKPYGIPLDSIGNPVLSQSAYEGLYVRSQLQEQQFQNQQALNSQNHCQKMEEIQEKARAAALRDQAIAARKLAFEESTLSAYEDSAGKLCIERHLPDGTKISGQPLFRCSGLRVTKYRSSQSDRVLFFTVSWDGCEAEIIIKASKLNDHTLLRELAKAGYPIQVGKNRKKEIGEIVFGYLLAAAKEIHLSEHFGWNKANDTWCFCWDVDLKLKVVEVFNDE